MIYIAFLYFVCSMVALGAIIGFSQIFKLGQGVRLVWAAMILITLVILLIAGVERALETAAIPSPTPEDKREEFFEKYVDGRPGMSREQFN